MGDWVDKLGQLKNEGKPFVLVSVVKNTGSTPREVGAKMVVLEGGTFYGTIGGGRLEQLAIEQAQTVLAQGKAKTQRYPLGAKAGQCCGGLTELFFEPVNFGPALYLFGAGHVGRAVCQVLEGTPFRVTLIDSRSEWVQAPQIPASVTKVCRGWEEFIAASSWSGTQYCLVMTHSHAIDQAIVAELLKRETRYLGLIGSQSKWQRFRMRYLAEGLNESMISRVKCPVGLDIGGKTPKEIAISVGAELLSKFYGKLPSTHSIGGTFAAHGISQGAHSLAE